MTVLLAGLCTVDVVQRVDELPAAGEKVQSRAVEVAAGGPATNAAVTAAALGEKAVLLTVLGSHPLAGLARSDLDACGVRLVDALPEHPSPPPVSAAAVREHDGERTVVSHNAAAVPDEAVDPAGTEGVEEIASAASPGAVLVDGHHPRLALAAARWARDHDVPVVVDAGSWKPVFDQLLPLADVVACSVQFAPPEGALRAVPVVITTAGADPVRWRSRDDSGAVPVPAVTARDTLGAGDVWHGAFAAALGSSGPPEAPAGSWLGRVPELVGFANRVAAERVRHSGPRNWLRPVRAMMGVR